MWKKTGLRCLCAVELLQDDGGGRSPVMCFENKINGHTSRHVRLRYKTYQDRQVRPQRGDVERR